MRGKAQNRCERWRVHRITPAYAGKSFTWVEFATTAEDHPRLCGEKRSPCYKFSGAYGSPPPMRGKAEKLRPVTVSRGITPAYAGKSSPNTLLLISAGDHPRLCGEKTKKIPKQRYFFH